MKKIISAFILCLATSQLFAQTNNFNILDATGYNPSNVAITGGTISNTTISGNGSITGTTITATNNISNMASPGRTIRASLYLGAGNATSGQGGSVRLTNDAGVQSWLMGILGTGGATDLCLYDIVNATCRFNISAANGNIGATNHLTVSTAFTPTIASGACGTGTNGTISGTDQDGKVTIGAASTTSCAITFGSSTWASGPNACVITPATSASAAVTVLPYISAIATTGFTLSGAVLASTSFYYHCG